MSDDFWLLAGRPGGQTGFGGTGAGQSANFGSTVHSTKGFINFGADMSYDETLALLGIGTNSPSARVHVVVPPSLVSFARPASDTLIQFGWSNSDGGGTPLFSYVNDLLDATYIKVDLSVGGSVYTTALQNVLTDPGVNTGHSVVLQIRKTSSPIPLIGMKCDLIRTGGTNIKTFDILPADVTSTGPGFDTLTLTLSEAEAATLSAGDYTTGFTISLNRPGTTDAAGARYEIGDMWFQIPAAGGGSAVALQKWGDGTRANTLQYALDANALPTLELTGTPLRIATTALEFDIGTPAAGNVWSAQDSEGTGAWVTFASLLDDDLEAIAALTGTNGILTKTAANTWALTAIAQGDLFYGSAAATLTALAKDTNATRYLSNTGASNNPAWAQVNLANGVSGDLPFANLTQGSARSVLGVTGNATADVASIQGTADQFLKVNAAGTALAFEALTAAMLPAHTHSSSTTGGDALSPRTIAITQTDAASYQPFVIACRATPVGDGFGGTGEDDVMRVLDDGFAATGTTLRIDATAGMISEFRVGGSILRGFGFESGTFKLYGDTVSDIKIEFLTVSGPTSRAQLTLGSNVGGSVARTARLADASGTVMVWNNTSTGAMPSAGSIVYSGGTTSPMSELAIGAANTVLVSNGTIPGWSATLAGLTLTAPKFADLGFIADANGNEMLIFDTVASAVNEVTLANAATGGNPTFTASGGDTNIGLDFQVKGTGVYNFKATASGPADIRLFEDTDNGTNYVSLIAPASMASNFVLTLPGRTSTIMTLSGTQTVTGVITFSASSGNNFTGDLTIGDDAGDTLTVNAGADFTAGFGAASANLSSSGSAVILSGSGNIELTTTTGTKIGTATTQKLGFWNKAPIVQPTALTAQLTSITHTAPGTPDYAIQALTAIGGFGFVTQDEGHTVLSVIANLQTRVQELENKLSAAAGGSGLIA